MDTITLSEDGQNTVAKGDRERDYVDEALLNLYWDYNNTTNPEAPELNVGPLEK